MFRIVFANSAWFLLLLIPAIALVLFLYFRLSKKYRRTRNRVISVVLQILVIFLSVSVLAGLQFAHGESVTTNEVILLVDMSHSNRYSTDEKIKFVEDVLDTNESQFGSQFKVGIVIFAQNQDYVAHLNHNVSDVRRQFLEAIQSNSLNDSATNIADALVFAQQQFSDPKIGKIVLMTDGIQTDGDARVVIESIVTEGTKIDMAFFPNTIGNEVQINGIVFPEQIVEEDVQVPIGVIVQSSYESSVSITLFDNDIQGETVHIVVRPGIEIFYINHTFKTPELHELFFKLVCNEQKDTVWQNNSYYSYIYIDVYDKILIIERTTNDSEMLATLIKNDYLERGRPAENVSVVNISMFDKEVSDAVEYENELAALREYDKVILMNIHNRDMPTWFSLMLRSYVYDFGGGLFTVGGDRIDEHGNTVANAYDRLGGMPGSPLQQMLPVDCINWTPPVAVVLVIDISGSMSGKDTGIGEGDDAWTRLDLAKAGAMSALNALSERDFVGVVAFDDRATTVIPMTPMTRRALIEEAIDGLAPRGGTVYRGGIDQAIRILLAEMNVERKHILFITDGEPGDNKRGKPDAENQQDRFGYLDYCDLAFESDITLSALAIAGGTERLLIMEEMAEAGGGAGYQVTESTMGMITQYMREDLNVFAVASYNPKTFTPKVDDKAWSLPELTGFEKDVIIPDLGGFYGTRIKRGAHVVLSGEFGIPLYARWMFGEGRVGSFMSDLNGKWSSEFLADPVGKQFLLNALKVISPTKSIRARNIDIVFPDSYNYYANLRILPRTALPEGDRIKVTVSGSFDDEKIRIEEYATPTGDHFRYKLVLEMPGIYTIEIQRTNSSGVPIGAPEVFIQTFSYSKEYNVFAVGNDDAAVFLQNLAMLAEGKVISNPEEVFGAFDIEFTKIRDPRIPFIIIAIILFLIDIAVRKFKFKWPWEIIRDRKLKKQLKLNAK